MIHKGESLDKPKIEVYPDEVYAAVDQLWEGLNVPPMAHRPEDTAKKAKRTKTGLPAEEVQKKTDPEPDS